MPTAERTKANGKVALELKCGSCPRLNYEQIETLSHIMVFRKLLADCLTHGVFSPGLAMYKY